MEVGSCGDCCACIHSLDWLGRGHLQQQDSITSSPSVGPRDVQGATPEFDKLCVLNAAWHTVQGA
eukprot:3932300-Amphidinium_carterae.1